MKSKLLAVVLLSFMLGGCNNINLVDGQESISFEADKSNVLKEESIITEKEIVEDSDTTSENIEEETTVKKTIAAEDVVYEENDVVFVIAKSFWKEGDNYYGYLISAGGKVVPFQVAFDDFFAEEMEADFGKIIDMETEEPIMLLEEDVINYYIDLFKNINIEDEMDNKGIDTETMYESIEILGRKISSTGDLSEVCIFKFATIHSVPLDSDAIELMNWLLELNDELTDEAEEGIYRPWQKWSTESCKK